MGCGQLFQKTAIQQQILSFSYFSCRSHLGQRGLGMTKSLKSAALIVAAGVSLAPGALRAEHAWNNYHWEIDTNGLSLEVEDNVSAAWDAVLDKSITDWNLSPDVTFVEVPGSGSTRNCKATDGKIKVCNDTYGYNGWLGVAQIWLSGDHIVKGVTKLNDSYFNLPDYDTYSWRHLVMCQEIGHDIGLAHVDEDFYNADQTDQYGKQTCMDYTDRPEGNEEPNQHDYDQLAQIYLHTHEPSGSDDGGGGPPAGKGPNRGGVPGSDDIGNFRQGWGRPTSFTADGRPDVYLRRLGDGQTVITHVFWVPDPAKDHTH